MKLNNFKLNLQISNDSRATKVNGPEYWNFDYIPGLVSNHLHFHQYPSNVHSSLIHDIDNTFSQFQLSHISIQALLGLNIWFDRSCSTNDAWFWQDIPQNLQMFRSRCWAWWARSFLCVGNVFVQKWQTFSGWLVADLSGIESRFKIRNVYEFCGF